MRISRLCLLQDLAEGQTVSLETKTAHYVRTVLRLKAGAELTVFNGQGAEYQATLGTVERKQVQLEVGAKRVIENESPLHLHLGLSVSRGERMDIAIQKATELGVDQITPILTEHCVVKLDEKRKQQRHQHWQQIIISACEQCGRNTLPVLNLACDYSEWLSVQQAVNKIMFEPGKPKTLKAFEPQGDHFSLLIGPEGGFSENEVKQAEQSGFTALSFGPRVVRNETAAIAAITAAQVLWGDMA